MKLTPQQKQIIDYLNDGEWHCMTNATFFMKDDRTRISELRRMGYFFEEQPCDSRAKCKIQHNARLYMRRLIEAPKVSTPPKYEYREIIRDGQRMMMQVQV